MSCLALTFFEHTVLPLNIFLKYFICNLVQKVNVSTSRLVTARQPHPLRSKGEREPGNGVGGQLGLSRICHFAKQRF